MRISQEIRVPLGATVVGVVTLVQSLYGLLVAAGVLVFLTVLCGDYSSIEKFSNGYNSSDIDASQLSLDEETCSKVAIVEIAVYVLVVVIIFELIAAILLLIGVARDIVCCMGIYIIWTSTLVVCALICVGITSMYLHGGLAIASIVLVAVLSIVPVYFIIIVGWHCHQVKKRTKDYSFY